MPKSILTDKTIRAIKRCQPDLLRYAERLSGCPHKAKDIRQDAMLRFWEAARKGKFEEVGKTKQFLLRTVYRCFVNDFHKGSKDRENLYNLYGKDDLMEESMLYVTFSEAWRTFDKEEASKVLSRLPDQYRLPLQMRAEGYSYNDIAAVIGKPVGSVKSAIFRGRKKVKNQKL